VEYVVVQHAYAIVLSMRVPWYKLSTYKHTYMRTQYVLEYSEYVLEYVLVPTTW
jgi:hypothetical protein